MTILLCYTSKCCNTNGGHHDVYCVLCRRKSDSEALFDKVDTIEFKGTVEAVTISRVSIMM